MGVLAWVTGIIIAVGFGMAGVSKLTWQQQMADAAGHLRHSQRDFQMIGLAEVVGAAGVLLGTAVVGLEFVAIGAALGLALLGGLAALSHIGVGDPPKMAAPASVLGLIALVCALALTLR